jgi:hypothetical protein
MESDQFTDEYKNHLLKEINRRFKFIKETGDVEYRDEYLIDRFIKHMDMSLPMVENFRLALQEAMEEGYNRNIRLGLIATIEDTYKEKDANEKS